MQDEQQGYDWDAAYKEEVPEERPDFDAPPAGAWLICATQPDSDNDWSPGIRPIEWTDKETGEERKACQLELGFQIFGGEAKVEDRFRGKYVGFRSDVHPNVRREEKGILGNRTKHLLNSLFAPGVGDELLRPKMPAAEKKQAEEARGRLRQKLVYAAMREAEQGNGLRPDMYGGDQARFQVGCAVLALQKGVRLALVKTRADKDKKDPERVYIRAGQVEDYTPENCAKRKVRWFNPQDEAEMAPPPPAAAKPAEF